MRLSVLVLCQKSTALAFRRGAGTRRWSVPNASTYETWEMRPMSLVPLSGVKVLYANNDNDGIEQDESDIMVSLGM
jgi:hypothetical protein